MTPYFPYNFSIIFSIPSSKSFLPQAVTNLPSLLTIATPFSVIKANFSPHSGIKLFHAPQNRQLDS